MNIKYVKYKLLFSVPNYLTWMVKYHLMLDVQQLNEDCQMF